MQRGLILFCAVVVMAGIGCSTDPLLSTLGESVPVVQFTEGTSTWLVFGPAVATRTDPVGGIPGAPTEWSFTVTRHDLAVYCEPTFRLVVTNGHPDGTGRVTSGSVSVDGVRVIAPSAFSRRVARIERDVALGTGSVITARVGGVPDGRIEITVEGACVSFNDIVGTSAVEIPRSGRTSESIQGNLVADALIDQYGTDFAFMNSGGLRADLTRPPGATDPPQLDDLGRYNIARENVISMLPFGNVATLADVDGPTLKTILDNGLSEIGGGRFIQVAGLRIDYALTGATSPAGWPIGVIVAVEYWNHPTIPDGTPVDLSPSAIHTIAVNDFMAAGGDGYPVLGDRITAFGESLAIAVERYLLAHSPVNPQIEGRIVQVPAP